MTPIEYIDQRIQSLSCGPQDSSTREEAAIIRILGEVKQLILVDKERMTKAFKEHTNGDIHDYVEIPLSEVMDIINDKS